MTLSNLKRSQRQEKRIAERYHGTVNSGSGNGWVHKNDVRTARFSFEAKTTTKQSYSIKYADLIKAEKHALVSGREMVFVIELGGRNWYLMSEHAFDSLIEE
ncbi:hypothetical protein [Streptomyces sp. WZ-12]|uniref:hypothetical protein n=1 Tax=Streptomyces sp. WZ-12 TaxID=3030210 RepID=UPI00238128D5|nr:hypothetical protein [Streptomyces sp. WZ-12]